MALEYVPAGPERLLDSRAWTPRVSALRVCHPPVGFAVYARGPKQESTNMSRQSKEKSVELLPVRSSCPGDLYVRVSDLLRNKEVQEQIHKMAKIAEDGEARGKRELTDP